MAFFVAFLAVAVWSLSLLIRSMGSNAPLVRFAAEFECFGFGRSALSRRVPAVGTIGAAGGAKRACSRTGAVELLISGGGLGAVTPPKAVPMTEDG